MSNAQYLWIRLGSAREGRTFVSERHWPRCSRHAASEVLGSHNGHVVNALPKSAQRGARKALQDIYNAEDRDHALKAVTAFEHTYGAK